LHEKYINTDNDKYYNVYVEDNSTHKMNIYSIFTIHKLFYNDNYKITLPIFLVIFNISGFTACLMKSEYSMPYL
jgi:hypothetical protein